MATIQPTEVKLFNAALDEVKDSPAGMVLRGALLLTTLPALKTDDYQREVQPLSSQERIMQALKSETRLPDVDLGMRGQNYTERNGMWTLKDPTFIIDGLQRVSTIMHYRNIDASKAISIGATVHFDTNRAWEKDRFHKLNNWRNKLSPNITLRNMKDENPAINTLFSMSTNDRNFVLNGRVSWGQRMTKGEMITALTLVKIAARLHQHKGAGGQATGIDVLTRALARQGDHISLPILRDNTKAFFNLIDECWGIKSVTYKEGAIYMRGTFLSVMAKLLSDHHDFWVGDDEKRLFIEAPLKRKIAQFPISDPEVRHLAGSSGKAREILYLMLRDHINSGKRSKHLKARSEALINFDEDKDEPEEA